MATTEKTDDTQTTGAPDDQAAEQKISPRMAAMDAIRVKRDDDEGADEDVEQIEQPVAKPRKAVVDEDDEVQAQLEDEPQLLEHPDKVRVKVKVDGVESEVTVAEAIRNYQKQVAADRRLAEANQILAQARALPPAKVDNTQGDDDTAQQPDPNGDGLSAKTFIASLFEGDEEKAIAALQKFVGEGRSKSPTLDLDQIADQLTPVLRQRLVDASALEKFQDANPDLADDPYLTDLTNRHIEEAMAGGTPYQDALGAGAKRTREWMVSMGIKPAATPNPTTSRNEKLERKGKMDNINSLNKTATTTQEPVQTTSDVLAEMRKSRGMEV